MRILAIDLGRIDRLSARAERETMLRLVCAAFADVVAAVAPLYGADARRRKAMLSDAGVLALARAEELGGPSAGNLASLQRLIVRLRRRRVSVAEHRAVADALERMIENAVALVDLEIVADYRALSAQAISEAVAYLPRLRTLALCEYDCPPETVGAFLASETLRSVRVDSIRATRTATHGHAALWALDVQVDRQSPSWVTSLLQHTGHRLCGLAIDAAYDLSDIPFAVLCSRMRRVELRQAKCRRSHPLKLPPLDAVVVTCECSWKRLVELLATGARSIEVGPTRAYGWPHGQLSTLELVRILHDSDPFRPDFGAARQAYAAAREVLRRRTGVREVRFFACTSELTRSQKQTALEAALAAIEALGDSCPGLLVVRTAHRTVVSDRRAQFTELPELLGHIVRFHRAWPDTLVERCRRLLDQHVELRRRSDSMALRRIAIHQFPDVPDGVWTPLERTDGPFVPPFTSSARRLVTQIARLYGFELVALDEQGRERDSASL